MTNVMPRTVLLARIENSTEYRILPCLPGATTFQLRFPCLKRYLRCRMLDVADIIAMKEMCDRNLSVHELAIKLCLGMVWSHQC